MMDESEVVAVARAREGDGDAFRLLVERHSRKVFHVAFRITGSEADAEDVVQETFLRAFRNLGAFEERAHFATWIHRIAVNCSLDWLRKQRAFEELDDNVEVDAMAPIHSQSQASPDRLVFGTEVRQRVQSGIEALSPLERSAFVLRHFEGMSIEEISSALGVRSSAAKHCIFRAVRKMRRALGFLTSATP